MPDIPSVHSIRKALADIAGAIVKINPEPEEVTAGTKPALRTHFPKDDESEAKLSPPSPEEEEHDSSDAPPIVFEIPPAITDAEIEQRFGDEFETVKRLQQIKGLDAYGWYVSFHQEGTQYGIHLPLERLLAFAIGPLGNAEIRLPMCDIQKNIFPC
jgi:hypothetical protein